MFPNGDKLIGTRAGLFFVQEKAGKVRSYTTESRSTSLRSDIIVFINRVSDKILIGTYGGGIHVFDEKTQTLNFFFMVVCFILYKTQKEIFGMLLKMDFIKVLRMDIS